MSETTSNLEGLQEDVKGVVSDVLNSDGVKRAREMVSELSGSEGVQFAKNKLHEAADSELAQSVKAKLEAAANDTRVKRVLSKAAEDFSNAKHWVSVNWAAGKYGKFRVVAAGVIVLLAARGLMCGWGGASGEVEAGDAETFVAGSSGGESWAPEKHTYACRHCGNQIQSISYPTGFRCPQRPQRPLGKTKLPNLNCEWQRMD